MPTVTVKSDNRPEGTPLSVPYLGKFKNGEAQEVPERNVRRYYQFALRKEYDGRQEFTVRVPTGPVESKSKTKDKPKEETPKATDKGDKTEESSE